MTTTVNTRLANALSRRWSLCAPVTDKGVCSAGVIPSLNLQFYNENIDSRITFTRASSGSYYGSDGYLKTATTNTPRIDYDPVTLAAKGLLIEESRANLLTYSEQFDNATAWTKTRSSVSANAATAPDGTVTADKLVEDSTASNSHPVTYFVSGTSPNQTLTVSVYAKAAERTWVRLFIWNNSAAVNQVSAFFNLSTGVVGTVANGGTGTGATATIVSVGNGWYRCVLTGKPDTSGTDSGGGVYPATADTVSSYNGDGTSGIYIWGAQLEAGAFATSYIPTTSAATTRAADVASMTGTNFSSWYRADEGTFVARYDITPSVGYSGGQGICGSGANARYMYLGNSGTRLASYDGVTVVTDTGETIGGGVTRTSAVGYTAGTSRSLVTSGGTITASATCASGFTSGTELYIGSHSSTSHLNGHITSITYYRSRLTNSQLQGLSQ